MRICVAQVQRKAPERADAATPPGGDDSCVSTQDASQLNCRDPVWPALLECDASVDEILPQLTSSSLCVVTLYMVCVMERSSVTVP